MACEIPSIPGRLPSNGRENFQYFHFGEFLFRRCKEEEKKNPFDTISLVDLSVNRSGSPNNILSVPEDVLYNTRPDLYSGEVFNLSVCVLQIQELDENNQYIKTLSEEKTDQSGNTTTNVCNIILKHKKEECNYSHCAFEFYLNGIEVTYENYKSTLRKNNKIRTSCKQEISKMILKEEVRINWPSCE